MIDLFFRATDGAAMKAVLTSDQMTTVIGKLVNDEAEDIRGMAGVEIAILGSNFVVTKPGTTDPQFWVQIRLHGAMERADVDGAGLKWDRSKVVARMKEIGTLKTLRGVAVYEIALPNSKTFQIWNGKQLADLGIQFHEFFGGNQW